MKSRPYLCNDPALPLFYRYILNSIRLESDHSGYVAAKLSARINRLYDP